MVIMKNGHIGYILLYMFRDLLSRRRCRYTLLMGWVSLIIILSSFGKIAV